MTKAATSRVSRVAMGIAAVGVATTVAGVAATQPASIAAPLVDLTALIVVGSSFFYGYWNPWYVWLPYLLVAISFFGTLWQQRACDAAARRWRVTLVVAAVLAALSFVIFFFLLRYSGTTGKERT